MWSCPWGPGTSRHDPVTHAFDGGLVDAGKPKTAADVATRTRPTILDAFFQADADGTSLSRVA